ncbi:TPA: hypothetical protein ENS27_04745 [bacterium]|nr:hypothetical protein [bacterium]
MSRQKIFPDSPSVFLYSNTRKKYPEQENFILDLIIKELIEDFIYGIIEFVSYNKPEKSPNFDTKKGL